MKQIFREGALSAIARCFISLLIGFLLGCGGGTTGTSSTGELKLIGEAIGANNRPAANKDMIVYSGGDLSQELGTSATDANGRFEMVLPGSESAVSVAVEGGSRLNIRRKFSGSSIVSALLVDETYRGQSGIDNISCALPKIEGGARYFSDSCSYISESGKAYSLRYAYEIFINPGELCSQLSTDNNSVLIEDASIEAPCEVTIVVYSEQIPHSEFSAKLVGRCRGQEQEILKVVSNSDGEMRVDLSALLRESCELKGRIEVFPSGRVGLKVSVPVN
jgi:hypothetical protein